MTRIKLTTGEWLPVTVPEGAKEFKVSHDPADLEYRTTPSALVINLLPEGFYSLPFPCVVGEMTEEQAGQVVEKYCKMYKDYESKLNGLAAHSLTATASLLSLCSANGWNPSTTILLKVNN